MQMKLLKLGYLNYAHLWMRLVVSIVSYHLITLKKIINYQSLFHSQNIACIDTISRYQMNTHTNKNKGGLSCPNYLWLFIILNFINLPRSDSSHSFQ